MKKRKISKSILGNISEKLTGFYPNSLPTVFTRYNRLAKSLTVVNTTTIISSTTTQLARINIIILLYIHLIWQLNPYGINPRDFSMGFVEGKVQRTYL